MNDNVEIALCVAIFIGGSVLTSMGAVYLASIFSLPYWGLLVLSMIGGGVWGYLFMTHFLRHI